MSAKLNPMQPLEPVAEGTYAALWQGATICLRFFSSRSLCRTGLLVFGTVEWGRFYGFLVKKLDSREDDGGDGWVVGVVYCAVHASSLNDEAVGFKEALAVSEMVWADIVVGA